MQAQIKAWGNSQEIRISKDILQEANVTSKDFFNQTGQIIGCPILQDGVAGPLHIKIIADNTEGYVHCEKLVLLDLNARGFLKVDRIIRADIINITDAIQGIFDYV